MTVPWVPVLVTGFFGGMAGAMVFLLIPIVVDIFENDREGLS